jgi:hypothetical protein
MIPVRQLDAGACGGSATCRLLALPHLAFGQGWATTLTASNQSSASQPFTVSFFGDNGSPIALPFTGGVGSQSVLTDNAPALGVRYYVAENSAAPETGAWGLVTGDSQLTLHATFRRRTPANIFYEASVPAVPAYTRFSFPFDATVFSPAGAQMYTGVAIANLNPAQAAQVLCVARDENGALIPDGTLSIPQLPALGHWAGYNFPALAGKRGRVECTASTLVAAIALRAIGSDAISTLPVTGE